MMDLWSLSSFLVSVFGGITMELCGEEQASKDKVEVKLVIASSMFVNPRLFCCIHSRP
jgi:hypothetical protein